MPTPTLGIPRGMTEHQVATACLCNRSSVTPAYGPPSEFFPSQERRWHTPQQCGYFESGKPPVPAIRRDLGEPESRWHERLRAAYPIIEAPRLVICSGTMSRTVRRG